MDGNLQLWIPVIIVAFVLMDFLFLWLYFRWRRSKKLSSSEQTFVCTQWGRIVNLQNTAPAQALMEADKLLDHALASLGYVGSFADKFQKAQYLVPNPERVWQAHKLRNRIAHESGFQPDDRTTKQALLAYYSTLRSLGAPLN